MNSKLENRIAIFKESYSPLYGSDTSCIKPVLHRGLQRGACQFVWWPEGRGNLGPQQLGHHGNMHAVAYKNDACSMQQALQS